MRKNKQQLARLILESFQEYTRLGPTAKDKAQECMKYATELAELIQKEKESTVRPDWFAKMQGELFKP